LSYFEPTIHVSANLVSIVISSIFMGLKFDLDPIIHILFLLILRWAGSGIAYTEGWIVKLILIYGQIDG